MPKQKTPTKRAKRNSEAPIAAPPPDLSHIAADLRALAVPIDSLTIDPANARRHPDANLDSIKGSLRSFGQVKPIVVRAENRVVCCGNGTVSAAQALGWTHIAANFVPMSDTQAAALAIADNRTAELAEWDQVALDSLLATIKIDDAEMQAMLDGLNTAAPAEATAPNGLP